ncbi:hypothetical protein MtrunA17_Chr5g0446061 [Medicago truncatula]|uniref:Uncharacterized protein n=1 Tax=Medicago truncatula TaxID=3880 RepID=G7K4K5_MEDTR|nr:hypothetical protein MTR_5g095190 [Medicago truncatula]RHN57965.1 hypothetical protein MtrunA17_Chr5g0446061 [Medicago truncatula]
MVCMSGRYVRIDPRNKTHGQGYGGRLDGIGYRRRVKARMVGSRPLLDPDLNKSTTASQPPSVVAAAADSSSSKDAATVLDLSPANLVKCSTSTSAAAKIQPVVKKKKKKKLPRFGAIIKLLRLGKKKYKKT